MIRRFVIILALVGAWAAGAQPAPTTFAVSGDDSSADLATGETTFRGHAKMTDSGLLLLADEIRYNSKTRVVTAGGNIVFSAVPEKLSLGLVESAKRNGPGRLRADLRLLANQLVYHVGDGTFTAESVRLGSDPFFVEGDSASGTRTEITVHRGRVVFGEPGPWQPTFSADRITYGPGHRLRSENARLGIGDVRPLALPKFQQDLALPFAFAVSLNGGYRASLGGIAEAYVHMPVSPTVSLGGDLGIYTSRGVMVGPSGRYADPENPENLQGRFRSGYIRDYGDRKTDILGRPVPEDRAFVEWRHTQRLGDNLTLTAQLNWWKDSEVLRDFRPQAFFPVQAPDTFVESVYTGQNYYVSAFARFQPNTYQRVQERLPEVRFDLLPLAVGSGFYQRFNASAAVLRDDPPPAVSLSNPPAVRPSNPTGGVPLRSDRLDAYYAIMRPYAPSDWAAITPVAGGRITHYANQTGAAGNGSYTRLLGEVGLDAELRANGTFAYQNEQWKIDGLRHLFTPRISYRYIPGAEKGRARIPPIDRTVFFTYLPPLGLGNTRNLDDLHATNTLRLAFDNTVQTRDPAQGSRDLLVFNVANDFRFRRQPGERDVSEVHAEFALLPTRWLQLDAYESLAPQTLTLREFNSGITLRDGNAWSLRFANNFLHHEIEDYIVDARMRINEVLEARTRLHYDARKHRFNDQAYGIAHNLGNTWLISYTVSLYSGRRRESGFGFNVQIDTVRF